MNFKPVSFGIELPEVTSEPVNIADRNLIWQHGFPFVTFFSDSLSIVLIAENMCVSMTHRPHICVSKLKSVHNTVHHREHCHLALYLQGHIEGLSKYNFFCYVFSAFEPLETKLSLRVCHKPECPLNIFDCCVQGQVMAKIRNFNIYVCSDYTF